MGRRALRRLDAPRYAGLLILACACERPAKVDVPAVTRTAECREDSVDVVSHRVRLEVDMEASLRGEGTIAVRMRAPTSIVSLDAGALEIENARVEEHDVRTWREGSRVCIQLPAERTAATIDLRWHAPNGSRQLHYAHEKLWAGYDPTAWMPTRRDPAQRATLSLDIEIPKGFVAVGTKQVDVPSPPFLYAFAMGRFESAHLRAGSTELEAYARTKADADATLAVTKPMVLFLEERLGPGPAHYTQALVHDDAAQEAFEFGLISDDSIDELKKDPHEDWIFSHELAHQWFGVKVPCADFADFWLNEGFATFMVAAIKEKTWGREAYDREVALWRKRSANVKVHAPLVLSIRNPRESELQPRGITYSRGALALHRLREELGDDVFWRALRRYVTDQSNKPTRTQDLKRALESASGRDLTRFFERWVYVDAPDL